ncbi:MAG: hypothetical protein J6Y71_04475 [Ruminococcus sp.]|nr:hypothetical protein [Ruminococcus sp.]
MDELISKKEAYNMFMFQASLYGESFTAEAFENAANMIDQMDPAADIHKIENLMKELLPVLRRAFFANYTDTNKANELYDRITKIVGRE